ncbi:MAG: hypothetical protein IJ125_09955 [Atopobiaceae bacterium]|nr:hypothetical protein [Atopobiaceae bacterium]
MNTMVTVGKTPLGEDVKLGLSSGLLGLIQGQSGSGKSVLSSEIVISLAEAMGASFQPICIDPKRVSLAWLLPRAHVYINENDWLQVIDSLCSEMERRYLYMLREGLEEYPISPERPFILLVLEEMSAITNSQHLLKKEREHFQSQLVDYVNRCRQCGMGLLIICQSCDSSVMPTVVRSDCSTRFAMKTSGQEQVKMISAGREEECPCDLLTLPGQFYALTSETGGRWIKGRAPQPMSMEERVKRVARLAADKRTPYCLKWDSPEFLG